MFGATPPHRGRPLPVALRSWSVPPCRIAVPGQRMGRGAVCDVMGHVRVRGQAADRPGRPNTVLDSHYGRVDVWYWARAVADRNMAQPAGSERTVV